MRIAMTTIRQYSTGCLSVFFLLFAVSLSGCNGNGFQGIVYEKTLILISGASSSAQKLLHKIRPSGVKKLYATAASSPLLQPLKDMLLLPITVFDPANVQSLVDQITTDTTKISLVEINKSVGEEIITKLNAYPYPVIYADETGNIIVITISSSGSAKVVHVRY